MASKSSSWFWPPKGPMTLGEGPIYRPSDSTLHWVDCLSSPPELYILQVDPVTGDPVGNPRILALEDSITVMCFRQNHPGSYIAAYYQGICFLDEATGRIDVVKEIILSEERDQRRFNDGGIDAKGRFWLAEIDKRAAAYGPGGLPKDYGLPRGRVWRYDPDGELHQMLDGVICGNGLVWGPDNKTMYLNDSVGGTVTAYNYDLESGSISDGRVLVDHRGTVGEPDGMVVDIHGNLWNAVYGTNRVMVYSPQGERLKEIVLSGKKVTCTTWGGKENNVLYITSGVDQSDDREATDEGGCMFMYKTDTTGLPKREFAG